MKKTLITLLLIIASCMYSHAELMVVDGIQYLFWPFDNNDTCAVCKLQGNHVDIIIPEEVELKSKADNTTKKYKVTWINYGAFEDTEITSITLPNTLRGIDSNAFKNVKSLNYIDIPKSVTQIGDEAFAYSGIKAIEIPENVTIIGNGAFEGTAITTIKLSDNITTIGSDAFNSCAYLKTVQLSSNLQSIGSGAFWNCVSLISIEIPDKVETIGYSAFQNCVALQSVSFGKGLRSIGSTAFAYCTSLEGIVIPDNVEKIGNSSFFGSGLKTLDTGNGLKRIPNSAFFRCDNLAHVTIGNNVDSIMPMAFYMCDTLQEITIPENVKMIGNDAFYSCKQLKSVLNGEGVDSIGNGAFRNCQCLRWVELGSKLRKVRNNAFQDSKNIKVIVSHIQKPEDVIVYLGGSSDTLYVPRGTRERYIAIEAWSHYYADVYKSIYPTYEEYSKSPGARQIIEGEPTSGIAPIIKGVIGEKEYYDMLGRRNNSFKRGLNIVRMSDGRIKKVIYK